MQRSFLGDFATSGHGARACRGRARSNISRTSRWEVWRQKMTFAFALGPWRDLNPQPIASQAIALPLSYRDHFWVWSVRTRPSESAMNLKHRSSFTGNPSTTLGVNKKTSRSSITTKVASKEREVMVQLRSPQEKRDLPRSHPHSTILLKIMALWSAPRVFVQT